MLIHRAHRRLIAGHRGEPFLDSVDDELLVRNAPGLGLEARVNAHFRLAHRRAQRFPLLQGYRDDKNVVLPAFEKADRAMSFVMEAGAARLDLAVAATGKHPA